MKLLQQHNDLFFTKLITLLFISVDSSVYQLDKGLTMSLITLLFLLLLTVTDTTLFVSSLMVQQMEQQGT